MQKKRNIIKLNDTYNEADTIKYIKSYMFIKGFTRPPVKDCLPPCQMP